MWSWSLDLEPDSLGVPQSIPAGHQFMAARWDGDIPYMLTRRVLNNPNALHTYTLKRTAPAGWSIEWSEIWKVGRAPNGQWVGLLNEDPAEYAWLEPVRLVGLTWQEISHDYFFVDHRYRVTDAGHLIGSGPWNGNFRLDVVTGADLPVLPEEPPGNWHVSAASVCENGTFRLWRVPPNLPIEWPYGDQSFDGVSRWFGPNQGTIGGSNANGLAVGTWRLQDDDPETPAYLDAVYDVATDQLIADLGSLVPWADMDIWRASIDDEGNVVAGGEDDEGGDYLFVFRPSRGSLWQRAGVEVWR